MLNTNLFVGFASEGALRQLKSPSSKMGDHGEVVPMQRNEEISQKIKFLEDNYDKLKKINETLDTREMSKASLALYEFVLPVYKKEYIQLAASFDTGLSKEKITLQSEAIHDKYFTGYDALHKNLISIGKVYADKHSIKVNWNIGS